MNTTLDKAVFARPEISVDKSQLQRQMGNIRRAERFLPHIERVLDEAAGLWKPQICWARYRVEADEQRGEARVLDEEGNYLQTLTIGQRTNLLNSATECFVAVGTVGPELSQRIGELEKAGSVIDAYLMDIVGVLALNATHKEFRAAVESYGASRGWGVGPVMQPGSLEGWALEDQQALLSLLPIEKIGVTLNEFFMMTPQKTNSTLVGVGPDYNDTNAHCLCEDCARLDCPWRRDRVYGE